MCTHANRPYTPTSFAHGLQPSPDFPSQVKKSYVKGDLFLSLISVIYAQKQCDAYLHTNFSPIYADAIVTPVHSF